MQTPIPIPGPLRLGDLLDRAFRLYRAGFWPMVLGVAVFMTPLAIVAGLTTGSITTDLFKLAGTDTINTPNDAFSGSGPVLRLFGLYFLILILTVAAYVAEAMAMVVVILIGHARLHGRSVSLAAVLRHAFGRLPTLLVYLISVAFAYALVIGVLLLPLIGLTVAATVGLGANAGRSSAAAIVIVLVIIGAAGIGLLMIMLPLIYLNARWLAAIPCIAVEGTGPFHSLRRSWQLTRGQALRSIGYTILLYILGSVIVAMPMQVIQQVAMIAAGPTWLAAVIGLSTGLAYIARVAWLPLQASAYLLLYYDFRVRGENLDLALRVQHLEAELGLTGATPPAPANGPAGIVSMPTHIHGAPVIPPTEGSPSDGQSTFRLPTIEERRP